MSKRLTILLLIAFIVRLCWVFVLLPYLDTQLYSNLDGDGYLVKWSEDFQNGLFLDNPGSVLRMPLYPGLIASISSLVSFFTDDRGILMTILQIWNILLDLSALIAAYLLVRKLAGERAALIAGALYAFYPFALYRLPMIGTEIPQTAALAFWVWGAVVVLEKKRLRDAALLSLLSAVLVFISPATQLMPVCLVIYFFLSIPFRQAAKLSASFLIPVVILSLGWGARNTALTGEFFLFDVRGGKEFWLGNFQAAEGRWEGEHRTLWEKKLKKFRREARTQGASQNQENAFLYQKGIEEILSNPTGAAILFVKKFFRFWTVPASERLLWATVPIQSFYLLFALMGIYFRGITDRRLWIPIFIIVYFCGIYTLSYACIRFSHPIMPWVCALAGIGVHETVKRLKTNAIS